MNSLACSLLSWCLEGMTKKCVHTSFDLLNFFQVLLRSGGMRFSCYCWLPVPNLWWGWVWKIIHKARLKVHSWLHGIQAPAPWCCNWSIYHFWPSTKFVVLWIFCCCIIACLILLLKREYHATVLVYAGPGFEIKLSWSNNCRQCLWIFLSVLHLFGMSCSYRISGIQVYQKTFG